MSKYIDAERLKAEIERLYKDAREKALTGDMSFWTGFSDGLDAIEQFVDSLQQEQQEVDLKEEITSFFSKNPIPYEHITDWPLLKNTALHFYELGQCNARKEG